MKNLFTKIYSVLLIVLITAVFGEIKAAEWEKILNLKGTWKFSIGDDINRSLPDYDDSDWETIRVPSSWENEGFYGYNGYAWYRKEFQLPDKINSSVVFLDLGAIDDVDQTFINGNLIGASGTFPPDYQTAYYANRKYPVPIKYLKPGKNVIAVRVFDSELEGGILRGDIGLYIRTNSLSADINLEGEWKFCTGDNKEWANPDYDDKNWRQIIVPGFWETQGFNGYDGFAWYRNSFFVSSKFKDKKLVLIAGRIDDLDEVYLNGVLIGSTGEIHDNPFANSQSNEYQQFRGYFIPDGVIKTSGENTVAVRVWDGFKDGGIYEGPVGIITQEKYTKFWRERRKNKNIFELFFE